MVVKNHQLETKDAVPTFVLDVLGCLQGGVESTSVTSLKELSSEGCGTRNHFGPFREGGSAKVEGVERMTLKFKGGCSLQIPTEHTGLECIDFVQMNARD